MLFITIDEWSVGTLHEGPTMQFRWDQYRSMHMGSMLNQGSIDDLANYMYCKLKD